MNKWEKKKILKYIWFWLPWVWLFAGYAILVWYQLVPGRWLVDSDMSVELILSKMLNEEGGILSHNWYYTSELRVFQFHWIFRVTMLLFPNNWHIARTVGMAVLLAIFTLSCLYMCKSLGFQRTGVWITGTLIWPFGRMYFYIVGYSGFYAVFIIFVCLIVGLISSLAQKDYVPWKKIVLAAALAFLSFASGTNGVRQTMMSFVPLLGGGILFLWLEIRQSHAKSFKDVLKGCKAAMRLVGWIFYATGFNVVGYLYNYLVLSKQYEYVNYDFLMFDKKFSVSNLLTVWSDFLSLFGYQNDVELYTFGGIATFCGLVIAFAVVFSLVRLCMRYPTLQLCRKLIVMTIIAGLLVCGSIFAFANVYMLGYHSNYWVPLIPFILVMLGIELDTECFDWEALHKGTQVVFACMITITAVGAITIEYSQPLNGLHCMEDAAKAILDSEYTTGYASYWSAGVLTELTDGRIEVIPVDVDDLSIFKWGTKRQYAESIPEGPVFILINRHYDERINQNPFALSNKGDIFLDTDDFWAVGFESAEEAYQVLFDAGVREYGIIP